MKRLEGMSMDIEKKEREKLKSVFPECFVEDKLDIDKLLNMCGEYITNDFEKYKFEWKGKSECYQIAQRRTTGTLRPCKEESVNFDTTQNLYIEGDNLEVLKILQRAYYRQVKIIYIDPPYNTGNDFIYEDDFKDPMERYKEVTQQTTKSNPETMGRFHTNWLNMMFPRLRLASNLLRDDGVIFISIDDHEVHNLRKLCDEVFGEENFVCEFIRKSGVSARLDSKYVSVESDYVLMYAKNKPQLELNQMTSENMDTYSLQDEFVERRGKYKLNKLDRGSISYSESLDYPIKAPNGELIYPGGTKEKNGWCWRWSKEKLEWGLKSGFIEIKKSTNGWSVYFKQYQFVDNNDNEIKRTIPYKNLLIDNYFNEKGKKVLQEVFDKKTPFDYPKPLELLECFIKMSNVKSGEIVLDFFSGSATTAHAVMQLNAEDGGNRRFIMVQLPELCSEKSEAYKAGYKNICEIGKERIRRAGAKLLEKSDQTSLEEGQKSLDVGFKVFKLDTSNLKAWDSSYISKDNVDELLRRLKDMIVRIKPDRTDMDIVYEVMLKLGIPLTYSVSQMDVQGKKVYAIGDDCLVLVCLDKEITPEIIKELVEYAPGKIVMADGSFEDNTAMSNAYYILKNAGINLKLI